MKLGIISDTHDFLDPRVPELLKGVDHILHAGDIGLPWILLELQFIAPVTAVGGNTDDPSMRYEETKVVALDGRKFLVHHIVDPRALKDPLKARIAKEKPQVVVFGHTHKAFCETMAGVLYFNSGYAGRPKFNTERTLAILHCSKTEITPEFLAL